VISQNYPNLDYIIVDGGSTDNSVEIIKKYEQHLTWWVSESDRGQSHAINKGFQHATGDLLAWLNSDDYLMAGALDNVANLYILNKEAGGFVGAGQMVDSNGLVVCYKEPEDINIDRLLDWGNSGPFMQPSCFFSKEAWDKCGPLDESLHFTMDINLWLNIAKSYRFATCNELYSTSLIHHNAKTTAFQNRTMIDLAIVLMRHGGEAYARQILSNMEQRLSYAEPNLKQIINNPIFRQFKPVIKLLYKPKVKWSSVFR